MNQDLLSSRLNRRVALKASAAIGAAIPFRSTLAQDSSPVASPASGEWSFTDDKGVTITLPERPQNLVIDVNAAAPLWDFGIRPTALFGWNVLADGTLNDAGGNIDPEGIPTVGDVNETIRLEDTIAVDPDLIITISFTLDDPQEYWSITSEVLPQVQAIAPILAISATGFADKNTERYAELAEALGADVTSDELVAAKEAYEEASTAFDDAIAANADLTVLFIAITPETAWVASPPDWSDLNMYQSRGMNIVQPDAAPNAYWEEISHEQALKYPADIMLQSTRPEGLTVEEVLAHPTFGQHPAALAGQVFGWNQDFIHSYQGMTEALDATRGYLEQSQKVVEE